MKMPFVLDAPVEPVALLAEQGVPVDRDGLLKEYKSGSRSAVTFSATTYIHGPNRNHTRLNDAELEKFAESFKGQPFLQDHARNQAGRGGTILDSKLVDVDGKKVIRQTIKAVKPWAVEGILDETVDRFSIGWNANEYECTADGKPFFKCGHGLADLGNKDEKSGKTVEVLMKGLEGMEVSAVTHPAVPGTGVLDALRQLQESNMAHNAQTSTEQKENPVKDKVFTLLGLSAETTEADALLALEKRLTTPPTEKVPAAMLTALGLSPEAPRDEAIAKVVGMTAPGAFVPKADNDKITKELAELRADNKVREAMAAGRITPASAVWARGLALDNPDAFDAYIKHAPTVPLAGTVEPPRMSPNTVEDPNSLTERERLIVQKMGVKPEAYLEEKRAERARAN